MRFFRKTILSVNEQGRVTETDSSVIDADNSEVADLILDRVGQEMQANGFAVYWGFDETSFKAVHTQYADIIRYVKVTEL